MRRRSRASRNADIGLAGLRTRICKGLLLGSRGKAPSRSSGTLAAIAGAVGEALHGLDEGLVQTARERYLQGAEDIMTTLDVLYERGNRDGAV